MKQHKTKWTVQFIGGGSLTFKTREDAISYCLGIFGCYIIPPIYRNDDL